MVENSNQLCVCVGCFVSPLLVVALLVMSAFNFRSFSELAGGSLPVAVSADELFRFKNDLQGFPLLSFSVWVYFRFPVFSVGLSEIWGGQEPTTRSLQLPYWAYVSAFLQTDLFLDYLFGKKTKAVPVR